MSKRAVGRSLGTAVGVMLVSVLAGGSPPSALGSGTGPHRSSMRAEHLTVRPTHGPAGSIVRIHGTGYHGAGYPHNCPLLAGFTDADGTGWTLKDIPFAQDFKVRRKVPKDAAVGTGTFMVLDVEWFTSCVYLAYAQAPFEVTN